jgi:hypothetical protein
MTGAVVLSEDVCVPEGVGEAKTERQEDRGRKRRREERCGKDREGRRRRRGGGKDWG